MARTDATDFVTDRPADSGLSIAVIGLGVVGGRVARQLSASGRSVVVFDQNVELSRQIARSADVVELPDPAALDPQETPVVILAAGPRQHSWAEVLLESGHHVVTTGDDLADIRRLLELDDLARRQDRSLVVGAAACPGLSGLLVAELASRVDRVDEIHVAFHGTGGPACARQHHVALAGEAWGWHDGDWIRRPGGSGRDLLWFPEPIGGKDCYRAALADPILLHEIFPEAQRISARMAANRRDRLTARLPMLSPPHPEGGLGGVRVEVRGSRDGERRTEVAGVAERTGIIAAAVAASCGEYVMRSVEADRWPEHRLASGAFALGSSTLNNRILVDDVIHRGITVFEYVGAGG